MLTRTHFWAVGFLAGFVACVSSEPNAVRRARIDQREAVEESAAERGVRERVAVELEIDERNAEIDELRARLAEVRAERSELIAEVDEALRTVAALEEDLLAARARQQEIEQELAPIRALEAELAAIDARQAELGKLRGEREAELAALADREAQLGRELEELRAAAEVKARAVLEQIEWIREIGETLDAALRILAPQVPAPEEQVDQRTNESK